MFNFSSPFQGLAEFTLSLTTITFGHLIEQNCVFGHAFFTTELFYFPPQISKNVFIAFIAKYLF